MTRRALTSLLAVAGFAVAVVPPAAAGDTAPPAALSGFACRTASNPLNRYVEVTATMRPSPSTARMKLRFVLLQRVPGHPSREVFGGDLGHWRSLPAPYQGVKKLVANLPAPAAYRFRVSFLWLDSSGGEIARQTLLSAVCHQPS